MKQWLQILSEEKERILNMHLDATKKNYLSEQTEPPQLDLATYRKNCLNYYKGTKVFTFTSDPLLGKTANIIGTIDGEITFSTCKDSPGSVCPQFLIKDSNTGDIYTFVMIGKKQNYFKLVQSKNPNFKQAEQTRRDWKCKPLYKYLTNNLFALANGSMFNQTFVNVTDVNQIYPKWCKIPNV